MVMWSLEKDPRINQECAKEAHDASSTETSSKNERSLHEDASQRESRLAYCRAVILETLWLHPPVYSNCRVFNKDIELDGYTIPRRTRVCLPIISIHTDERNVASQTDFLPERWVRTDANTDRWVARYCKKEPEFVENDPAYIYIPPANPH